MLSSSDSLLESVSGTMCLLTLLILPVAARLAALGGALSTLFCCLAGAVRDKARLWLATVFAESGCCGGGMPMARCHAMRLLSGSIIGPPLLYRAPGYAEHAKSQVTGRQGNILNAFPQIRASKFLLCSVGNRALSDQLSFILARR